MDYSARNFTQEDNYCQITVNRSERSLRVRLFDRRGKVVQEEDDKGEMNLLDERLDLAPW